MGVVYPITLNVFEPNNDIGILRIRQSDEGTQTVDVQILEDALPKSYFGLQVFFCSRIGQTDGLGIIEQKLNAEEMTDPRNGKFKYTFRPEDWQVLGRQNGYFSFRKMVNDHTYIQQFSTRDFTFEVTKSIYSDGIKEVIKDGSTYVWTFEDLLRLFKEFIQNSEVNMGDLESQWANFVEQNKDIIESIDPSGEILTALGTLVSFRAEDKDIITKMRNEFETRGVNPYWFGAKGDGTTDDTVAITAAFNYAKASKQNIFFENKKYIYNPADTVEFSRSIDFGHAELIRNDGVNVNKPIVKLVNDKPTIEIDPDSFTYPVTKGTQRISQLAGYGNAYVQVEDSSKKIFKREGVANDPGEGVTKFDQFTVDNDGYLTSQLTYDFDDFSKVTVFPINSEWSVIKGGKFLSIIDESEDYRYFKNGIEIQRSNTIIENIYHDVDQNKVMGPRSGFINVQNCANIILRNVKLQPLKYADYGTYDFNPEKVVNLTLENVIAQNYTDDLWGFMGGNFLKNVLVANSKISRFDAHMGITNLTIRDSEIGRGGIQVVGYGKLTLSNIETYAPNVIKLRSDYGSFWDGEILVKDVIHHRTKDEEMNFILGDYKYDFDYGDDGRVKGLARGNLSVENYTVDDHNIATTSTNGLVGLIKIVARMKTTDTVAYAYRLPKLIHFNKCQIIRKSAEINGFYFFADINSWAMRAQKNARLYGSGNFDANVQVVLDGIDFYDFSGVDWRSNLFVYGGSNPLGTNGDDDYGSIVSRPFWQITVKDSTGFHASTLGRYVKLNVYNTDIYFCLAYQRASRSWLSFVNCRITPRVSAETSVAFKARFDRWYFVNCYFDQVFIGSSTTVVANPFAYALQDLLAFATGEGQPIVPTSSMSGCGLTSQYNLSSLKPDIGNFDFRFGDFIPYRVYHGKKGATTWRPKTNLAVGLQYYDTSLNKLLVYDGSAWRDTNGNVV